MAVLLNHKLLHSGGENLLVVNFHFDAQRRPQVGALHDGTAYPHASRDIHHFERIVHRSATRIADHRVFGGAEVVVGSELLEVGDVLEAAISERRIERKRPIARGRAGGTGGQVNQHGWDVFSTDAILVNKVLRGPGGDHLFHAGDRRLRFGCEEAREETPRTCGTSVLKRSDGGWPGILQYSLDNVRAASTRSLQKRGKADSGRYCRASEGMEQPPTAVGRQRRGLAAFFNPKRQGSYSAGKCY